MDKSFTDCGGEKRNLSIGYAKSAAEKQASTYFNIISNEPVGEKESRALKECDRQALAFFAQRSLRNQVEIKQRVTEPIMQDTIEKRRLQRIAYDRFKIPIMRGFDIISNEEYRTVDVSGRRRPGPRTRPSLTPWEKISS